MDPDFFRVASGAIFAPVVAEIADQFLFLGIDGDHRLLFGQRRGHLGVDVAELRIPVEVAVALRGLAVALQTVTRLIEQAGDQGAACLNQAESKPAANFTTLRNRSAPRSASRH